MKTLKLLPILLLIVLQRTNAQQVVSNQDQIKNVLAKYTNCVIAKDSVAFYKLFIDGPTTWYAAVKDRSMAKRAEKKPGGTNLFSASYKSFMRSLFGDKLTEDKFDNLRIIKDGAVATVTMDYSFWVDHKMTNWGNKDLLMVKEDGEWKIASVLYSVESANFFPQPTLKERQGQPSSGTAQ
jgi:hypothetical protein